jgi:glutathione-independent formaldehyde dehydrogenase
MYEGRTSVEVGKLLGHENMGIVQEVGAGVSRVKVGDRVSVPFNVACGSCRNCVQGWTSFCLRMNPTKGMDGAAYGYANIGPYDGGQAEYLRVPHADFNLLAAHSAMIRGASQVFVVDKQSDRLGLAEKIGATAIDFAQGDPSEQIMEATHGRGADCGVEAVGYQAHDSSPSRLVSHELD